MRVDVFVFKGNARVCDDLYLRYGHIGVQFRTLGEIFGFGPKFTHTVSAGDEKRLSGSGEFSPHTAIFARAVKAGLSVVRIRTTLTSAASMAYRLQNLQTFRFMLPTNVQDAGSSIRTANCVSALQYLGVALPERTVYISHILRHVMGAEHVREIAVPNFGVKLSQPGFGRLRPASRAAYIIASVTAA